MKKIIIIALFAIISLQSCHDYLDIVPDNTVKIEDVFQTKEQAYTALATCYSYFPKVTKLHESMGLAGDEFNARLDGAVTGNSNSCRGIKLMRGFQNANDPLLSYWEGKNGAMNLYEGIRNCNIFVEQINQVPDMSEVEKLDWSAQVNFLKAFYHFYLLKCYGPIIIVDENVEASGGIDEVRQKRATIDESFNYIVDLVDKTIKDLPDSRGASYMGQIDKTIAMAFKAKVLTVAASPFYNGNSDFYSNFKNSEGENYFNQTYEKEKWKKAIDALEASIKQCTKANKEIYYFDSPVKLFDQGTFDSSEVVQPAYNSRFVINEAWNEEIVWGYSNLDYTGQGHFAHACNMRMATELWNASYAWNWLGASYRMTELYYSKNGLPIEEDKTFDYENRNNLIDWDGTNDKYHYGYVQTNVKTMNMFLNREPRFYAWLAVDKGYWRTHDLKNELRMKQLEYPGGRTQQNDYFHSGIGVKKLVHPESKPGHWARVVKYSWPIIRLADLHLMLAEARNEYEGPSQKVYDQLNIIRKRAGLKNIETVYSDASIAINLDKHKSQEGLREIIKRERLIELSFEGHRYWDILRWKDADKYFKTPIKGFSATKEDLSFYEVKFLQERTWETPKNYLFPLSINELRLNPNLTQNPGW
jgi:hypothetical protein